MKIYTENNLQQDCVIWFTNNFCLKHHSPRGLIFSVPNGGSRNIREAMTMKLTGLLKGASDLIVILPDRTLMFVELKIETGRQSDDQKEFETRVTELGFKYILCRSLEDFKKNCIFTI
jgi:hypothetical protein